MAYHAKLLERTEELLRIRQLMTVGTVTIDSACWTDAGARQFVDRLAELFPHAWMMENFAMTELARLSRRWSANLPSLRCGFHL